MCVWNNKKEGEETSLREEENVVIEKQLLQASVGIFIATFSFVRLLNLAIKGFEMTTTSRRKLSSKEIGRFQRSIYSFLCGLTIQQYINQVSFYILFLQLIKLGFSDIFLQCNAFTKLRIAWMWWTFKILWWERYFITR